MIAVGYYMGERVQTLGEPAIGDLQATLGYGLADEEDGDVQSYGGHLARVSDRLLLTDSDGNRQAYLALPFATEGVVQPGVMAAHLIVAKHRRYREQAEALGVVYDELGVIEDEDGGRES